MQPPWVLRAACSPGHRAGRVSSCEGAVARADSTEGARTSHSERLHARRFCADSGSATQHWRYSRAELGSQCTPSPTIDYHNATQTINYLTWQSTF